MLDTTIPVVFVSKCKETDMNDVEKLEELSELELIDLGKASKETKGLLGSFEDVSDPDTGVFG